MKEGSVTVRRTARYLTVGESNLQPGEVWFVCHGYRELARDFLGGLTAIDDGHRWIVAPEGLSRFYVVGAEKDHSDAVVGASWMTREDRENEIKDYVAYLDTVYDRIFHKLDRTAVRVTLLGFSQGAATASRWVDRGKIAPDRLVLWGDMLPADVSLSGDAPIRKTSLSLVAGSRDKHATPAILSEAKKYLERQGMDYQLVRFEGGHHLNDRVLRAFVENG